MSKRSQEMVRRLQGEVGILKYRLEHSSLREEHLVPHKMQLHALEYAIKAIEELDRLKEREK